jgi:hypothetical protein
MNLRERIQRFLRHNPDKWVSAKVLYATTRKYGYTHEATQEALEAITHIPPYAVKIVDEKDTKRTLLPGTYYCFHTIDYETLDTIKRGNAYFDSL